jgi:hypothetical protein
MSAGPHSRVLHAVGSTGLARLNRDRAEAEETDDGDERRRAGPAEQEIGDHGDEDDPCRQQGGIQPVVRHEEEAGMKVGDWVPKSQPPSHSEVAHGGA